MSDARTAASSAVTALLADIDGTVVTKDKVITERAIQAVKKMRERKAPLQQATRLPRGSS